MRLFYTDFSLRVRTKDYSILSPNWKYLTRIATIDEMIDLVELYLMLF